MEAKMTSTSGSIKPAEDANGTTADPGRQAVHEAAKGKVDRATADAATEWFLTDEEPLERTIEINVGTEDDKNWIPWTIRPVDLEVLRRIRRNSMSQSRRNVEGAIDEIQANLGIVVAGTVKPDLKEMAEKRGVPAADEVLRLRFIQKPGLLGQLASEILSLSGYDDADLRDPSVAVGN